MNHIFNLGSYRRKAFRNKNYSNSSFKDMTFTLCIFVNCDFTGVEFHSNCLFNHCTFKNCKFDRCTAVGSLSFCGSTFKRVTFQCANLNYARLCHTICRNADFSKVNFTNAIIASIDWRNTKLNDVVGLNFDLLNATCNPANPTCGI